MIATTVILGMMLFATSAAQSPAQTYRLPSNRVGLFVESPSSATTTYSEFDVEHKPEDSKDVSDITFPDSRVDSELQPDDEIWPRSSNTNTAILDTSNTTSQASETFDSPDALMIYTPAGDSATSSTAESSTTREYEVPSRSYESSSIESPVKHDNSQYNQIYSLPTTFESMLSSEGQLSVGSLDSNALNIFTSTFNTSQRQSQSTLSTTLSTSNRRPDSSDSLSVLNLGESDSSVHSLSPVTFANIPSKYETNSLPLGSSDRYCGPDSLDIYPPVPPGTCDSTQTSLDGYSVTDPDTYTPTSSSESTESYDTHRPPTNDNSVAPFVTFSSTDSLTSSDSAYDSEASNFSSLDSDKLGTTASFEPSVSPDLSDSYVDPESSNDYSTAPADKLGSTEFFESLTSSELSDSSSSPGMSDNNSVTQADILEFTASSESPIPSELSDSNSDSETSDVSSFAPGSPEAPATPNSSNYNSGSRFSDSSTVSRGVFSCTGPLGTPLSSKGSDNNVSEASEANLSVLPATLNSNLSREAVNFQKSLSTPEFSNPANTSLMFSVTDELPTINCPEASSESKISDSFPPVLAATATLETDATPYVSSNLTGTPDSSNAYQSTSAVTASQPLPSVPNNHSDSSKVYPPYPSVTYDSRSSSGFRLATSSYSQPVSTNVYNSGHHSPESTQRSVSQPYGTYYGYSSSSLASNDRTPSNKYYSFTHSNALKYLSSVPSVRKSLLDVQDLFLRGQTRFTSPYAHAQTTGYKRQNHRRYFYPYPSLAQGTNRRSAAQPASPISTYSYSRSAYLTNRPYFKSTTYSSNTASSYTPSAPYPAEI